MKRPTDTHGVQSPIVLLGSDHSKKKRQRTMVESSESSSIENIGSSNDTTSTASTKGNTNKAITFNGSFGNESITHSPRLIALLEASAEDGNRKIQQKRYITTSAIPLRPSTPTIQTAATILQQQQRSPKMGQPMIARPVMHKIEEHPPVPVPASQGKHITSSQNPEPAGVRDVLNEYYSIENSTAATIKTAVAVATAASTVENKPFTYKAINAAPNHHRIVGSSVLTADAAKSDAAFGRISAISSNIVSKPNLSLSSFSFPAIPVATSTTALNTKYNIAHLSHRDRSLTLQKSNERQLASYNAVHSDYKKIYKPLKRPPRLPTAHEALVIAALSTVTPTTSACR